MSDVAIRVEGLGKRYRIGQRERYKALRDTLTDALHVPFRAIRSPRSLWERVGVRGRNGTHDTDPLTTIWALKDVSFEVKRGEVVGIIGRNGAGKSTLLKILSRITEPTEGYAKIKGRVGSLLEVGTGFHPELTGRENIYLNGAILGMKKTEIDRKFDEIVAFAEVEQFTDTPVKHYSSGMHMRLAFAVAAHLETDILVIDEVLAVGDGEFQKKCLGKMSDVAKDGRTVLFVSHNLSALRRLCSRGLVLVRGRKVHDGTPLTAVDAYREGGSWQRGSHWRRDGSHLLRPLQFTELSVDLSGGQPHLHLSLEVTLETRQSHRPSFLAFDILDATGTPIMQALPSTAGFLEDVTREHRVSVGIELPPMIPGIYGITAWTGPHNTITLDQVVNAVQFDIAISPVNGRIFPHTSDHGYIVPRSTFTYHSDNATV